MNPEDPGKALIAGRHFQPALGSLAATWAVPTDLAIPLSYLHGFGAKAYPVTALTWGLLVISVIVTIVCTALVVIGDNQDELSGECRYVVRALRQKAGILLATNPRAAPLAAEIRKRTQEALRNPANHEGARH